MPSIDRDNVKLAQLVRARERESRGRRCDPSKISKNQELKSTWIDVDGPSCQDTKILLQVIKETINEGGDETDIPIQPNIPKDPDLSLRRSHD